MSCTGTSSVRWIDFHLRLCTEDQQEAFNHRDTGELKAQEKLRKQTPLCVLPTSIEPKRERAMKKRVIPISCVVPSKRAPLHGNQEWVDRLTFLFLRFTFQWIVLVGRFALP
jgi:hypothetical protein